MNEEFMRRLRTHFKIPDFVTDEILYDTTKDTYAFHIIEFKLALENLFKSFLFKK
jgi:hypothetical protein